MNLTSTQQKEKDNIIEELNRMGYHDTEGKTLKELTTRLAVLQIQVDNDNNAWF